MFSQGGYRATFALGTVLAGQDHQAIQGLKVQLSPYQARDAVPFFGLHGAVSRPLPGAQVVVLYQNGDPSRPVAVAVNDPRYYLAGQPDGTVGWAHHLGAKHLLLNDGTIISQAAGETLRKLVTDVFKGLFNEHTHSTPAGGSGPPDQQMTDAHLTGATRAGGP